MMQGTTIGLILATVACSAVGQLFLKAGAQHLAPLGPPRVPARRRPERARPVGARRLDRFDGLLALRSASRPVVDCVRADQPQLRADPPRERLRLRRTDAPPSRRRHGPDHHRHRLRALRRLSGRAGPGGACLLCPVPGSGAAAPIREVLEGLDRPPGRRASSTQSTARSTRLSWSGWAVCW